MRRPFDSQIREGVVTSRIRPNGRMAFTQTSIPGYHFDKTKITSANTWIEFPLPGYPNGAHVVGLSIHINGTAGEYIKFADSDGASDTVCSRCTAQVTGVDFDAYLLIPVTGKKMWFYSSVDVGGWNKADASVTVYLL